MRAKSILAGALLLCAAGPSSAAGHATQITAENAAALLVQGSDANGGIGDWALGNGVLCAVISDPGHESLLSEQGGVLTDLARCGVAHDEWNTFETLLNASREEMLGASRIRAEPNRPDGSVAIVVGTRIHGLEVETTYILAPERPDVLQVVTRAARPPEPLEGAGEPVRAFLFGDLVIHGRRQLAPFTLQLAPDGVGVLRQGSVGFVHPAADPDDLLGLVDAVVPANLHVLVGGEQQATGVSYGLQLIGARLETQDGTSDELPRFAINGESFSMHGVLTRPLYVGGASGDMGLFELAQTLLMDIEPGETLVLRREIRVGARADVASITNQLWPTGPHIRGRAQPRARIHVTTADGIPITQVRPDYDGTFAFRVPKSGAYALEVRGSLGRSNNRSFEVTREGLDLGDLALSAAATVLLPRGEPMRLVFLAADGGPPPTFGDDLLGFRVGERRHRGSHFGRDVSLGGIASDPSEIDMMPGLYRVIATRGPEFALSETTLEVAPGEQTTLQIDAPSRVLDHPGWISADMHVHSEWSDDSNFSVARQLAAFTAESADLIVSTEHDRVADYGPMIAQLGLKGRLKSLVGAEVTSSSRMGASPETAGHANVFPLPFRPLAFRGGAPRGEGRRLRSILAEVHGLPGRRLLQLNHPRSDDGEVGDLHFLSHLGVVGEPFRPASPLESWPNRVLLEKDPATGKRDLDFDVIELMNGHAMDQYRAVRADWISLLLQGEFKPAIANSDSHVAKELVGTPRTYVQMPSGAPTDPPQIDTMVFVQALAEGRAYGSTGPLLELALVSPEGMRSGIGDLHFGRAGTLQVGVRSAPWVSVSELRVWRNGALIHRGDIRVGAPAEVQVSFERDSFLTVEVSGTSSAAYAEVAPQFVPFAFSNPIFVDADGDGRYKAPGLPEEPLPILDPHAN